MAAGERIEQKRHMLQRVGAKPSHGSEIEAGQLSLFDAPQVALFDAPPREAANDSETLTPALPQTPEDLRAPPPIEVKVNARWAKAGIVEAEAARVLDVSEMPTYPDAAHDEVIISLKLLPASQVWFTYKDVKFFFGISRATIARRLKDGVVPGIRMAGSSVLEDTTVRRFDRDQLKWLLLSVRHRGRRRRLSGQ